MLHYFVCVLKLAFSRVFVSIQDVFCVEQVAAVFCVISSVNEVPYHVRSVFLMGRR